MVLQCEVANRALTAVRRAEEAIVTQSRPPTRPPAALCWASPCSLGWLAALLSLFFICDICSVLVPPVIPYPSQLCRPPALRQCRECPEHTAFLMCDKTEPSHRGTAREGSRISINLP